MSPVRLALLLLTALPGCCLRSKRGDVPQVRSFSLLFGDFTPPFQTR
jgi:hypothetical protein